MRPRPSALMKLTRGAVGLVKDRSCGPAAARPAKPVLEQVVRPRNAPPRHLGLVCTSRLTTPLKFWLMTDNNKKNSRLMLIGVALVAGVAIMFAQFPAGPTTELTGRIEDLRFIEARSGPFAKALVKLTHGPSVVASLERASFCKIGDPVMLEASPRLWGTHYRIKPVGCAR